MALRLMVYDRTCRGRGPLPGLSVAWASGARMYRALGRLDACQGVTNWQEALDWLASFSPEEPISEIQFWGHGKWGRALVRGIPLDAQALEQGHELNSHLSAIRERLVPGGEALWWFRTCETFGALPGHDFARAWTDFFGCRAAGHTFIIGIWQSGLHSLGPGQSPHWPAGEGLREGTPRAPKRALWSTPVAPNTITCFADEIPAGW